MKDIDWIKAGLLAGMAAILLLLVREWDAFQTQRPPSVQDIAPTSEILGSSPQSIPELALPSAAGGQQDSSSVPIQNSGLSSPGQLIRVTTDVLDLEIDLRGGDILSARLPQHQLALRDPTPLQLMVNEPGRVYTAQSGLVGPNGTDTTEGRPLFSSERNRYVMAESEDQLNIDLIYQQGEVRLIKRFVLRRSDYLIDVQYLIDNQSEAPWQGAFYAQIKRSDFQPEVSGRFGMQPYLGAAVTTSDDRYKKIRFRDMEREPFRAEAQSGWAAMLQHYFLSAWIPDPGLPLTYNLRKAADANLYYIGFTQPVITISPGENGSIEAALYMGPKDQYRLAEIRPNLDLTVDYGWLWWAAQPLFWLLQTIHSFVNNWGVAIILLTLLVKLVFFNLSAASYKSMAKLRKLQPKLTALKERYGDDRQAFSQEMMRLYQKEKVNPLGGCLPILVQMPVFIALYWVLMESVELRHAPFIGWIQDLSDKDPWFVLPILMGVSMYFQQKLNPPPPDPAMARAMQIMPIAFTFMFMWFPSGLVLYWTVNNMLSMLQQWVITRRIEAAD